MDNLLKKKKKRDVSVNSELNYGGWSLEGGWGNQVNQTALC